MTCKMRCAAVVLVSLLIGPSSAWQRDRVRLRDVEVITLRRGAYTTGRGSLPVPQLKCLGGSAGCRNAPSVVQCYNRGSDGRDIQWECKAEMIKSQKFGPFQVTCEGYSYPQDDYILYGSCGLEYYLEKTGIGRAPAKRRSRPPRKPRYRQRDRVCFSSWLWEVPWLPHWWRCWWNAELAVCERQSFMPEDDLDVLWRNQKSAFTVLRR